MKPVNRITAQFSNGSAAPSGIPGLREVIQGLFRYRGLIFASMAVSAFLSAAYLMVGARTYESSSKLFLRVGRESVTLDPTATVGQTVMLQKNQDAEINSAMEMLGSRAVAEKVVDGIGVDRVLGLDQPSTQWGTWTGQFQDKLRVWLDANQPKSDFGSRSSSGGSGVANPGAPQSADPLVRERAVRKILKSVHADAPKESMVITITSFAGTPQLAQEITQKVTDIFRQEHVRMHRTAGSLAFFQDQTNKLADELATTQQRLRDRKKEYGFVSVAGQQEVLEARLKDAQLAMSQNDRQVEFARKKVEDLRRSMSSLPQQVVTQTAEVPNPVRDALRERMHAVQVRAARQGLTDEHPLVAAVNAERDEAQLIVGSEDKELTHKTVALNPIRQKVEESLETEVVNLAALESQYSVLREQVRKIDAELQSLNDHQFEIVQLERQADLLEATYRTHFDNLEQARIDAALETERISNVNEVQAATFVPKPSSPIKSLVLLAGTFLGTLGGVGLALLRELTDSSARHSQQVEAILELPVVLSVPRTSGYRRKRHLLVTGR